jgi:hypothetical protein
MGKPPLVLAIFLFASCRAEEAPRDPAATT